MSTEKRTEGLGLHRPAIVLTLLLICSVGLNAYLLLFDRAAQSGPAAAPPVPAPPTGSAAPARPAGEDPAAALAGSAANPAAPAATAPAPAGLQKLDLELKGALSQAVSATVPGKRADWISATTARILFWKIQLHKDLRSGDRLRLLYAPEGEDKVQIKAVRLQSQKLNQEIRGYWYRPQKLAYGSYWDQDGLEVPARPTECPLQDYEQITALIGDGRRHKGVDFLVASGSPVRAVRPGVVTRVNWNFSYNGSSVEMRYPDGVLANFLHLDKIPAGIAPGVQVAVGQEFARSGNSGRSFAPHLHYGLLRDGKVLDPLAYHGTTHRRLSGPDLQQFQAQVAAYDQALQGPQLALATGAAAPGR